MAKRCEICGKSKMFGNNVTFSHKKNNRTWSPNVRRVKVREENGTVSRKFVCAKCLKSGKIDRAI